MKWYRGQGLWGKWQMKIDFALSGDHGMDIGWEIPFSPTVTHHPDWSLFKRNKRWGGDPPKDMYKTWQSLLWRITLKVRYRDRGISPQLLSWGSDDGLGGECLSSSHQHQVVPGMCKITPNDCHICSYSAPKGRWTMTSKQATWRPSTAPRREVWWEWTWHLRTHWPVEAGRFLSWQNRDSQAQHRPHSCLILCNPQLEQLLLHGVMLPFSGISIESFTRWTCVHSDVFRQLLSPGAEALRWLGSVNFGVNRVERKYPLDHRCTETACAQGGRSEGGREGRRRFRSHHAWLSLSPLQAVDTNRKRG